VTPERLRAALRFGVRALLVLAPLPYGSVQSGPVLAIELTAAALGLITILLIARDEDAAATVPRAPLAICLGVIALGIFQVVPLPFSIAEKFNPTVDLVRPLIPYLGLDHPPAVSWSVASPETTDALVRFIAYVLIGLAAAVAFDTESSRRRFGVVLVVAAVFQAVYGSGEYLSGRQHIFAFAKKYYLDSATGTFINRNHFGTLLAVALPFSLVLAIPKASSGRAPDPISWRRRLVDAADGDGIGRLMSVVAAALIWIGLLLSHSRAALAAALVGASIVLFRFRATRAARWTGALGAGVLLVLLAIETAQAPGERFLTLKEEITDTTGRPAVWRAAVELFRERPLLGWGFGTFDCAFPTVQSASIEMHYDHAHNDWLEWATEGGVLALGVAITLLGAALRNTSRSVRETIDAAAFSIACRAAIAALAVHAVFDFSLRIPAVAVLGSALLGMTLARPSSAKSTIPAANVFEVSLAGRISRDGS